MFRTKPTNNIMKWVTAVLTGWRTADVLQVSTNFILSTLGPCAKYSACLFPSGNESLEEAEVLMLESYCEKAQLQDGQDVLDLGCGARILFYEQCLNIL